MIPRSLQFSVGILLTATAGYVDAVGYIELGGFFASFMSGASISLGVGASGNILGGRAAPWIPGHCLRLRRDGFKPDFEHDPALELAHCPVPRSRVFRGAAVMIETGWSPAAAIIRVVGRHESAKQLEGSSRKGFLEGYFDERGERILAALHEVSDELDAPAAQVSLAWLLPRPPG